MPCFISLLTPSNRWERLSMGAMVLSSPARWPLPPWWHRQKDHYPTPQLQAGAERRYPSFTSCTSSELSRLTRRAWLNCLAIAFQHSLLWNGPVTPSAALFDSQGLRPIPFIMADLVTVGACLGMALALEFTGPAWGMGIAVVSATLGLVLFALSRNAATLSAGQVFYSVGFTGIRLVIDVLIADTAALRNRALAYGLAGSPWAITAFAVPALRKSLNISNEGRRMRYAIAAFTGIIPLFGGVLVLYLWHHKRTTPPPPVAKEKIRRDLRILKIFDVCFLGFFLMILFLFLWLVQMGLIPWWTAIIALMLFFNAVVFVAFSRSPWVRKQVIRLWLPRLRRGLPDAPMPEPIKGFLVEFYNRPQWERSEQRLHQYNPLKSRTMWAVCILAMTWKCELTLGQC